MSRPIKRLDLPLPGLPREDERIHLLDDIAVAEQQLDRGEGVRHESAKAKILRSLTRGQSAQQKARAGGIPLSVQELEAEALKLSEGERALLVERIRTTPSREAQCAGEDPIVGLGSAPVSCGTTNGASEHDRHLYPSK